MQDFSFWRIGRRRGLVKFKRRLPYRYGLSLNVLVHFISLLWCWTYFTELGSLYCPLNDLLCEKIYLSRILYGFQFIWSHDLYPCGILFFFSSSHLFVNSFSVGNKTRRYFKSIYLSTAVCSTSEKKTTSCLSSLIHFLYLLLLVSLSWVMTNDRYIVMNMFIVECAWWDQKFIDGVVVVLIPGKESSCFFNRLRGSILVSSFRLLVFIIITLSVVLLVVSDLSLYF